MAYLIKPLPVRWVIATKAAFEIVLIMKRLLVHRVKYEDQEADTLPGLYTG